MAWQGLKLNLKVAQKQILTPGLVQMVSVLALNRLELKEMINQEMIANPVLEEQSEEPTQADNYSDENFLKEETEKVPEKPEPNPFDEFDVGTFFNQYLDTGGDGGQSQEREVSERPSFEKFLSSPTGLTDHLQWQLSVTICSDAVRQVTENIIGNLDENGYLTALPEELTEDGKYSQDDLDDALAVVQEFDPIGVGAHDLRNYVKERFTAAMQLMKNIEQRKHTILRVCQSIIARQGEFLDQGPDALKPMMIKEVAEEVGVHPSTVSRAVASKYAHTPQGVLELRSFFSESVNGPEGSGMSLLTLKRLVKKMIEEEDSSKPLTDEQIAKKLDEAGIHVTRRTVAKYREDMRIPSTHQRRVKS